MKSGKSYTKNNNEKGFTLVELVVALAVFGILTALAVSVLLLINKTNEHTRMDAATQGNVVELEQLFSRWFNTYETESYELFASESGCVFKNGDAEYKFSFDAATKRLTITNPSATAARTLKKIDAVRFELLENGKIVRCEVSYSGRRDETYTYCFLMFRKTEHTATGVII